MDKTIQQLKIIRKISIIPFVILLIVAIYNSIAGVNAFINSYYYGIDAFLLTVIAYSVLYWWIGVLCIIIIIVTSVIICKQQNKR